MIFATAVTQFAAARDDLITSRVTRYDQRTARTPGQ
jgi:hypothetical protein